MREEVADINVPPVQTITSSTSSRPDLPDDSPTDDTGGYKSYPTDIIAAVTIAVLAVVVILTLLLVIRALRKRQRARRGERFGENPIQTVTTGVMGTGGAAYAHAVSSNVPVRGAVSWQTVNPSTSTTAADAGNRSGPSQER